MILIMHCQKYFLLFSLLIFSSFSLVRVDDNFNLTTKKTPDKSNDNSTSSFNVITSTLSSILTTLTNKHSPNKEPNLVEPNLNQNNSTIQDTHSADAESKQPESKSESSSEAPETLSTTFDSVTDLDTSPTTSPTIITEKDTSSHDESTSTCIFFNIFNLGNKFNIQPNLQPRSICSPKFHNHLNLSANDIEFNQSQSNMDNQFSLHQFIHNNNTLQLKLVFTTSNSFKLLLSWIRLDPEIRYYGILLSVYEDLVLIGRVFVAEGSNLIQLYLKGTKEIEFHDLNNLTYSIGLNSIYYSEMNPVDLIKQQEDIASNDVSYLIKNVFKGMKVNSSQQLRNQPISSNNQIFMYTIGSLVLLAVVVSLLYYRRNKFRSLISQLDPSNNNQNSKYFRNSNNNNPVINVSNYENSFGNDSPFEQQFLKNTAQLNNNANDRNIGFSFRNSYNRDKLSLNKASIGNIGRVLEQSVATIKKRTTLKSMGPTIFELDQRIQDVDSKYSHPIALINYLPSLHELTKLNAKKLSNEFMQLNILINGFNVLKKNSKVARHSKNVSKNRDGNILPYDHSRVILEQNKYLTSDYINASFIPGDSYNKEYIACPNPIKSTTYSFWLMCWQKNVRNVVMTTDLFDSHMALDKYWPDVLSEEGDCIKQIENLSIKIRDKKIFPFFTIRLFELKMNDELKFIKHYQLTEWNNIESTENVKKITEFIKFFRDQTGFTEGLESSKESPIVVHCSNGVGKTAVFIAIDRIYVQLKKAKNENIDIFGNVIEMRQYRPQMVQNETQYKFIYESVGELVRSMYPSLVKQMEFDSQLDEINLKETNDFDTNNNLDASFNSQKSLIEMIKNSIDRPQEKKVNGYTNHSFIEK